MEIEEYNDHNSARAICERVPYLKELVLKKMRKNGCNIIADMLQNSKMDSTLPNEYVYPFIDMIILFRAFLCPTDIAIREFLDDNKMTMEEFT